MLDSTSQSLLQVAEKMSKNQIVVIKDNSNFSADTQLVNTILKHAPLSTTTTGHSDPISSTNVLFAAHNIYCLSFIYDVIQFDLISDILGLDLDFVETSVINLINKINFNVYIDRSKNTFTFAHPNSTSSINSLPEQQHQQNSRSHKNSLASLPKHSSLNLNAINRWPKNETSNLQNEGLIANQYKFSSEYCMHIISNLANSI
ncbi:hypothetical protein AYI70_g2249 [Smittium culicis]|uniref:PCI domain-containing protein n=1 Tax=Smittium culicis TaxID=133412 RepID=A0A1R1Y9C9_9FUNG|nr:hypothetical protein AYI70_g2249 [Smittium culicis]